MMVDCRCCEILSNTPGLLVVKSINEHVIVIHLICGSPNFAAVGSKNFVTQLAASDEEPSGEGNGDGDSDSGFGSIDGGSNGTDEECDLSEYECGPSRARGNATGEEEYEVCDTQDLFF